MAVVRDRRQLNLRLPLTEIPDRRPRFPLPLPPTAAATSSTNNPSGISLSDLEKIHVLGHGNGGTVYKVRHKRTSEIYALKVIHADTDDSVVRRQVSREMEILRQTDSPYIVHCNGIYDKSYGDIAILMEYMDLGTLDKQGTFSEEKLADVARQVLDGLNYLHSHKIIHRDIKPSNLLAKSSNAGMEVKIADFGVSIMMRRRLDACKSYVGTCAYMSPERFDPDAYGGNYNGYLADIWSLGLSLLELYLGYFPLLNPGQRPDWATLMCVICFGDPPSLPEDVSDEFRDFLERCLNKDSSKRWTAAQLLLHPFVCKDTRSDR